MPLGAPSFSSSPPRAPLQFGIGSSPSHARDGAGRRSRFTYRHLAQLAASNTSCPLRVIAHIDLDAFYAQCEMVRLGLPEDKPLAVQQWQGLIAVNYPARASGIGRHCNVVEAMKLCPELIVQHVATWREGDEKWAYRDDAAANVATDKVSLDPYRLESRRILAVIRDSLPREQQRVEKASIDEVFLDLSAQVHALMLQRFPELAGPPPYDDPSEALPLPAVAALDWQADALVDLDEDEEALDPDWDDVATLLGSEIVRAVRARIRDALGYTCSAGVASNKLLSKLGSGFKKPNQQTVIRTRASASFLGSFRVTKLRNLGGKLGEHVVGAFHTESVAELRALPLDRLKAQLGDDSGAWVYNIVRGVDLSEINARTQIKSMLSAKSFRPTISTPEQADKWLRIFAADIFARLVEEGVLENRRRPRSINLHHRHEGQTRSRQGPIPQGRALDEGALYDLARDLLGQIVAEGRVWPCANLSLSVGGFEDGVRGNMGIGSFLVRGEEAESLRSSASAQSRPLSTSADMQQPSKKQRTAVDNGGIHRFFSRKPCSAGDDDASDGHSDPHPAHGGESREASRGPPTMARHASAAPDEHVGGAGQQQRGDSYEYEHDDDQGRVPQREPPSSQRLVCPRCQAAFDDPDEMQSHGDWHIAKDLQAEERVRPAFAEQSAGQRAPPATKGSGASRRGRPKKMEAGQSRLKFG